MDSSFNLDPARLQIFKRDLTDENRLIAEAIRAIMPANPGGVILDVGAGMGDIAAAAFPDRKTVLLDLLEFPDNGVAQHRRHTGSFWDFKKDRHKIDVMILSHVLQYIDDDIPKLIERIDDLNPKNIVIVSNKATMFDIHVKKWLEYQNISSNPEYIISPCPLSKFKKSKELNISSEIYCSDFFQLASVLSEIIYDAKMPVHTVRQFADWIEKKLTFPRVAIPQTVTLLSRETLHEQER